MADEPQAPDYRALCDAHGWPPIAGGAPEEETETPAEQETPESPEEASTEETPAEEPTPAEIDYEQRYNDLRPEYDRNNQLIAAAQGRHGPEAQMQALQQLGVEVEVQEGEEDYLDAEERLEKLEARLAEREQAEEDARFQQLEETYIDSTLKEIEGKEKVQLSDSEARFIINNAVANRLQDGKPNLQGAFDDLKGIKSADRESYRASKKNAPRAPVGTAGEDKIDLSNPDARRKYMAELVEAEEGSE